jgi:hypothetical protein
MLHQSWMRHVAAQNLLLQMLSGNIFDNISFCGSISDRLSFCE